MKRMTSQEAGLTLLALAEVPQVLSAFLPSPTTAAMGFGEKDAASMDRFKHLRRGEIVGSAVSLAIAGAIWQLTGSVYPMIGAGIVLAVFLWEYERAMREGIERASNGDQEAY